MASPSPAPTKHDTAPSGGFQNYRRLKKLINKALREGTPLPELHLISKTPSFPDRKPLSLNDLHRLLNVIRRMRIRYREILRPPVPPELVRDILAKDPKRRLPWEAEALEKAELWTEAVKAIRIRVLKELDDYLGDEFFRVHRQER